MSVRKIARRLLSLSSVQEFWKSEGGHGPALSAKLGADVFGLEDRTTPTFTLTSNVGGIAVVTNDAAPDSVTLSTGAGGGLTVKNGGAVTLLNADTTVKRLDIVGTNAAGVILVQAADNLSGVTNLRTVTVTGTEGADNILLANVANPNVYYLVDAKGGAGNSFTAPAAGVSVLSFSDTPTVGSSTQVTPNAADTKLALSFKSVTSNVSVNLATNAGAQVASYANMSVTLAAGVDATNITGAYGGKATNVLVGNKTGDILIGGGTNNTITAGPKDSQLDAVRDFSPAMPGMTNAGGVATFAATSVIDISQFSAISSAFAAAQGSGAGATTAATLFNDFGFFNFGEGVAALGGAGGVNSSSLAADFATANAVSSPAATAVLVGTGAGNDGLYGFNNAAVTANGGTGNDVFSTNTGGLPSTYVAGSGNDLLIGAPGFTLVGGSGNSSFSFAVANVNAAQSLQSTVVSGSGNSTILASFKNVTVDAGQGTQTVTIANDPTDVLIYNGTTNIVGGLGSIPLVKKVSR